MSLGASHATEGRRQIQASVHAANPLDRAPPVEFRCFNPSALVGCWVGGLWRLHRASSRPANPVVGIRWLVARHEEWLSREALCLNGPPKALQTPGPCTSDEKSLFLSSMD